jgi:hypothetical protein
MLATTPSVQTTSPAVVSNAFPRAMETPLPPSAARRIHPDCGRGKWNLEMSLRDTVATNRVPKPRGTCTARAAMLWMAHERRQLANEARHILRSTSLIA